MSDDLRARRRALARRHHPDLGGDPEAFDRAMRSFEQPATRHPGAGHDVVFVPSTTTRLRRRAAATRQFLRTAIRRAP